MARYITKSEADCDGWTADPLITNLTVSVSDPQDTGLLDSQGNTIWRVNDPVGFRF